MILDDPPLPIAGMAFTIDRRLMAGGSCGQGSITPQRCDSGRSWVWDMDSGDVAAMTDFEDTNFVHNDVAISPDGRLAAAGRQMVSSSLDGTVVLYDVAQLLDEPDDGEIDLLEEACLRANRNLTQAEWQGYFGDEPYRLSCTEILNASEVD